MSEVDKRSWEFKVEKVKMGTTTDDFKTRYIITRDGLPEYQTNDFLLDKSLRKISTGRTYANQLVVFLKFLARRNLDYTECTLNMSKQYVRYLIFGEMEDLKIKSDGEKLRYATIVGYINVMQEFYKHLKNDEAIISMDARYKKRSNKYAFLYGQIFEYDYLPLVDKHIGNLKESRSYVKWYTDEQIKAICSNFNTIRDETIFLFTLEGMRIDEALSVELNGIDYDKRTVSPTRSKGKNDNNEDIRNVSLPLRTYHLLNDYLDNERAKAESESGEFGNYIFINIKRGKEQGKLLQYHNYRKILRAAARRAGFDIEKIRTHSGRSTKVDELLVHQVKYPEDNLTDRMIQDMLGWSASNSIEPYKNRGNRIIMEEASKKVYRRKQQEINENIEDTSKKIFKRAEST